MTRFIDTAQLTRTFSRSYAEESELAFSALDCVLNGEKGVYASTELTSGRRAQAILREIGASRSSDLATHLDRDGYATRVWNPNAAAAMKFAQDLRHSLGGNQLVITPAPFLAPGWNQPEYLGFWETLIRTRVKSVYFNDDWEYSDGCTFEFSVALDAGLPTFDANREPLSVAEAIERIAAAIGYLRHDAIDVSALSGSLERVKAQISSWSRDS
jgi:hypothetical protein